MPRDVYVRLSVSMFLSMCLCGYHLSLCIEYVCVSVCVVWCVSVCVYLWGGLYACVWCVCPCVLSVSVSVISVCGSVCAHGVCAHGYGVSSCAETPESPAPSGSCDSSPTATLGRGCLRAGGRSAWLGLRAAPRSSPWAGHTWAPGTASRRSPPPASLARPHPPRATPTASQPGDKVAAQTPRPVATEQAARSSAGP